MTSLSGKVALISGTAGGMGREAALEFARRGASVVGCDLDPERSEETVRLARDEGLEIESVHPVDLTSEEDTGRWVQHAVDRYGRIDVLYNNASVARVGPWEEMTYEAWRFSMTYELDLVYISTKAAWPHLAAAGGGVVINVASIAGQLGARFVDQHAHGAAKGGVLAFTKHLTVSGARDGIRAVSISPGLIVTPATQPVLDAMGAEAEAGVVAITPVGRLGRPEDVARVAAFLASDDASFINGTDIVIDGGVTALR
ncbi:SDR family oxidoreductase [Nocardia sp. NPDC051911]|uniref:SDR family NAD(P)-dependent oxidoreductase n=1 Tax=Nocardia sp. NPDC051911 TaxID=3154648 RepID=UPI00342C13F3